MFSGFRSVCIRLRSCKTGAQCQTTRNQGRKDGPTGNTGEELPSKTLNLTAWEGYESVALKKVEYTLTQKISDYTNVIPKVETVP